MKKIPVEYGTEQMIATVPDHSEVVDDRYYDDPSTIDIYNAAREAINNPIGMPRISELVKSGSKVTLVVPDRVKGGSHEKSHRRVSIPIVIEELTKTGVSKKDITLLLVNGLHRKNTRKEISSLIGREVLNLFWPDRLICHDAEDPSMIIELGESSMGDRVDLNRYVYNADLTIVFGHCQGNPYGGYSGGYKTLTTGATTWKSISCHHNPEVMHKSDFMSASTQTEFRRRINAIGKAMEDRMGKNFFAIDAVPNTESIPLGFFAGRIDAVQEKSWEMAKKRTVKKVPHKADVIIFGLPRDFHYGPGHGTNPLLVLQAIGATLCRCYEAFNEGGIIIAPSICDGWFNDEWFPAYREVYNLFQGVNDPQEMRQYEEPVCIKPEYIYKYRFNYAYHPFHPFSMIYCGTLAWKHASKILIPGAREPGIVRSIGCTPTKTFEDAWKETERLLGKDPEVVVLPNYLKRVPVHLTY